MGADKEDPFKTRPNQTENIEVILRPKWWVDITNAKNGSLLQLHHPDHGWLSFMIPADEASKIGIILTKQSALCDYFMGTVMLGSLSRN